MGKWVGKLTRSVAFIASAQQFSYRHRQLHGEPDWEKRGYLLAQLSAPAP